MKQRIATSYNWRWTCF